MGNDERERLITFCEDCRTFDDFYYDKANESYLCKRCNKVVTRDNFENLLVIYMYLTPMEAEQVSDLILADRRRILEEIEKPLKESRDTECECCVLSKIDEALSKIAELKKG